VDGPGVGAHRGRIAVGLHPGQLLLTPPALLTGADTVFPVFVDPTWSSIPSVRAGYASVAASYPNSNYWYNTGDPNSDNLQVGDTGSWRAHTLLNFPIDASLAGANIHDAQLNMYNLYSYSCTKTATAVYAPVVTLTQSNATWNSWFGSSPVPLGAAIDQPVFANGYNSSCAGANQGFNITAGVASAVSAGRTTQTFVLTGVNETSDPNSWKKFSLSSINMSITYNHRPTPPQGLSTSPATSCPGAPTTVGDGPVALYATANDVDNNVNLSVAYQLWRTSDQATVPTGTVTVPPGSVANLTVPEATLKNASGGAVTQFSWRVQSSDDQPSTSDWSAVCSFNFDPTRTGPPQVNAPGPGSATIATALTVAVTHPVSGTLPTSYLYQLNGGVPGSVTADGSGNASITITPTRFTNTLTVTSRSAGGNIGDVASVVFNANAAADAADGDLTGDGFADLVAGGVGSPLPAGVWLAPGQGNGQVKIATTNLGANGNGVSGTLTPTDFNAAQVITGRFAGGHLQDVLAYYPTGTFVGGAVIINSNGDGSVLQGQLSGNESTISQGTLTDINGDNPIQLANAGNSSGLGQAYPDLIATSGDPASGYYLDYYVNADSIGSYPAADQLSTSAPDGSMNWNQWAIATAQVSSGTEMFLWNKTTGALYLWTNLSHSPSTDTLTHNWYLLRASGWNTGAAVSLRAADIDRDGTADLWTVGPGGVTTAWLVTGVPDTPTITAQTAQTLITANHAWLLNDATSGAVAPAVDSVGTLNLTGTGGAAWHTGDLFSPDVTFNGTGQLATTTGGAVATNADFTVSVWVKPTVAGGVVLSENGTATAGFQLLSDAGDNSWRARMATANSAGASWDTAAAPAGSVQLGIWTRLTATFKAATGQLRLWINGGPVATATHTTTWNAASALVVGPAPFTGQIATVQVWNLVNPYATTGDPNHVAGDLTGDGLSDALWYSASTNGGTMQVVTTNSTGTAMAGASPWFSNIAKADWSGHGDFNGDGRTDVIWYVASTGTARVLFSTGTGFSQPVTWFTGYAKPDWAQVGDFTGDGRADIAWYQASNNGTLMILSTSDSGTTMGPAYTWASAWGVPGYADVGDFNGDGRADILWYEGWNNMGGKLVFANSTGTAVDHITQWFTGFGSPNWARVADFNGDGKADIAWYEGWNNGKITLCTTNASGTAMGTEYAYVTGWGAPDFADVGDFNGDGKADILWYENWNSQGAKAVFTNTAGTGIDHITQWFTGYATPDIAMVG
jgi:hypothetical protein